MSDRLLDREQLHQKIAPRKTMASFNNQLTRLYRKGFPRPRKVGTRSVAWIESEVDAFVDGLERSSASASPNKKAKKKLSGEELAAKLREICRTKPTMGKELAFLKKR